MTELERLQAWFLSQCDGDWEHGSGIRIGTLDNPGWSVDVDLAGTALAGRSFLEVRDRDEHAMEWLRCWTEKEQFRIRCGPTRLADGLRIFLLWAEASGGAFPTSGYGNPHGHSG